MDKDILIGLSILGCVLSILLGIILVNSFGNTIIITSELDNVCKEVYGEGFIFKDTMLITETNFTCERIIKNITIETMRVS